MTRKSIKDLKPLSIYRIPDIKINYIQKAIVPACTLPDYLS